ncbi:disulfide-isomerase A3-like protein [Dinothrombium tinctorium]|uniref:Protein disulfide-isomerase n=1 Tax=Dinothrombium tinctorium TaxID=1965070 RepID=A0A3S3P4Z5_9ACAR|nr:disulfide-isomerase A3-like protein [Dinothrombium tinctorium]RWS12229.1 disulfide-isomerase A3-like protein [Dinothrombium tinctorium]
MRSSLVASLFFLPLLAVGRCSDVIELSHQDSAGFKREVASLKKTVLVEFFAPWCGHCKRLAPEYESAATILKKHDPPVPLVKVDCTSDAGGKDLCNEHGVSGYPTLKIFKDGEFHQEYNGPRDSQGIVKYMANQVGDPSKLFVAFAALNDYLSKANDVVVVGVFDSESDDLAKKFLKTADRMRESVLFAHIFASTSTGDANDVAAFKDLSVSAPAVVLVRPSILKNKFEPSSVLYDTSKSIEDFINENYHGLVGHRTQNNMQDFRTPYVVSYYDVDYVKNPKGTNYWRNRILKVAKDHTDITFAVSNSQLFAGELEEYGLEPAKEGRDAPPMVVARDAKGRKYVMTEKFSVDALAQFVKDLTDEKLTPYIKSEEIPADNSGPVKVAVGKNFDELVTNSQKDVLIEFYAPWCGHCKKLAPVYEEVGEEFKNEPNVEIVKMDATANDVSPPFVVHGFPTIYWYPSDTKEPKKYEGGREKQDFINFIAKHATKELKGFSRDGKKRKEEL